MRMIVGALPNARGHTKITTDDEHHSSRSPFLVMGYNARELLRTQLRAALVAKNDEVTRFERAEQRRSLTFEHRRLAALARRAAAVAQLDDLDARHPPRPLEVLFRERGEALVAGLADPDERDTHGSPRGYDAPSMRRRRS